MQTQCLDPIRHPAVADPNVIFSELFGEHRDRLYRFVLRHIGDSTEAEELASRPLSRQRAPTSSSAASRSCRPGFTASR